MQRDFAGAADIIQGVNLGPNPIALLVSAAIYGQNGMTDEAHEAADAYLKTGSALLANLDLEMKKRNFRDVDKTLFAEGLRKAGLPVRSAYLQAVVQQ